MIEKEYRSIFGETESDEKVRMIKEAKMCHNCFGTDISYSRGYRRCNKCGAMLDTRHIIWG